MKITVKLTTLLLCMVNISVGVISCESKASKEARETAIRIETEQKVRAEMEAKKAAEQERIAAEKKPEEEKEGILISKSNQYEKNDEGSSSLDANGGGFYRRKFECPDL